MSESNTVMKYDFAEFLNKAGKHCRTKQDLIDMANNKILKIKDFYLKPPALFRQQLYLKRLEGTLFIAKNGQFKYEDIYDNELAKLLDRLS